MKKKNILIGIASVIILLFTVTIIYQNYLIAPISAYQAENIWKEDAQNKSSINEFPEPTGIINDYEQIFTETQRAELTKILSDYDIKTTRQIVVVTIDSMKPYKDLQKYATDLANTWGVGNAEKNNGLTIVLCKSCRQISIATGLGTELVLTDEICKNVIEKKIIPEFKKGEFYEGIKNGITELIRNWE